MSKKLMFTRTKNKIKNHETGETQTFKSINLAKKESTRIQLKEDGAIGRGSLMVEK